jgi:hypothetical protein
VQGENYLQKYHLQTPDFQQHTNVKKFVANKPQLCSQQKASLLPTNGAFVGNKQPTKRHFNSTKRRFAATKWRFSLLFFDFSFLFLCFNLAKLYFMEIKMLNIIKK